MTTLGPTLTAEARKGGTDVLIDEAMELGEMMIREDLDTTKLSDHRKCKIGIYLAAHFTNITLMANKGTSTLIEKEVGESREEYAEYKAPGDNKGVGLNATIFGTQALMLDTSGTLAAKTTIRIPAQFKVLPRC